MADLDKLVEDLGKLTVLEAAELTRMLEETWGVSAAAPMAMAVMPGGAPAAAEAVEEKTEFDVILKDVGPKKIDVIKVIRRSRICQRTPDMAEASGPRSWRRPAKRPPWTPSRSWKRPGPRSSSSDVGRSQRREAAWERPPCVWARHG
jgi:hypothetical protein